MPAVRSYFASNARRERRRRRTVKRRGSRCYECGLLGFYRMYEEGDRSIDELLEFQSGHRTQLGGALKRARQAGRIPDEYNVRQLPIGDTVDWLAGGVQCGVGDHRGPRSAWAIRGGQDLAAFLSQWANHGALIHASQPDPEHPGPLGNVVASVQTFLWPLIRAHDCPHFVKHRAGLTPQEHAVRRHDRLRRWVMNPWVVGIGGGLLVAAIIAGIAWMS